jgi:hypothetical protein
MTTGAHAFVRTERVVQSTARTCAATIKLCLTTLAQPLLPGKETPDPDDTAHEVNHCLVLFLEGRNLDGQFRALSRDTAPEKGMAESDDSEVV